jgi:hypothetical protein
MKSAFGHRYMIKERMGREPVPIETLHGKSLRTERKTWWRT